jgi:hypothetical protein
MSHYVSVTAECAYCGRYAESGLHCVGCGARLKIKPQAMPAMRRYDCTVMGHVDTYTASAPVGTWLDRDDYR